MFSGSFDFEEDDMYIETEASVMTSGGAFRIVDLHADIPLDVDIKRRKGEHQVLERYHLGKLRKGLVSTIINPIYVEAEYKPAGALKRGLQILDAFMEDLNESHAFRLVRSYKEFLDAEAEGKIGMVLGVEGGEIIEDDLGLLRNFHRLGVRCFGLVWNQRNLMADGWDHAEDDQGLTDFGKKVIEELNRVGIIVDLSHMAPKSFSDALEATKHPVIVSHTVTSLLSPPHSTPSKKLHYQTDDHLKAVSNNGGIIGILAVNEPPVGVASYMPDLKAYCDHVEHAVRVAGPEHVGLGPDFGDYYFELAQAILPPGAKKETVKDLENHTKLGAVISELLRRGMSEEELHMITRDNFVRVLREVVG